MITPEQNINTGSTGGLGLEHRSFDRWYDNYPLGVVYSMHGLERFARRGLQTVERLTPSASRVVGRFLMGDQLLRQAVESDEISPLIEAAVPTEISINNGQGTEQVWMVMGAINSPQRRSQFSVDTIVDDVNRARSEAGSKTPLERIQQLRSQGYLFIHDIPDGKVDELLHLWGPTFDWDKEGIVALQQRLRNERHFAPVNRGVWFTGLINSRNNELVSVATAERLNMPVGDGRALPIVESTEWRTVRQRGAAWAYGRSGFSFAWANST